MTRKQIEKWAREAEAYAQRNASHDMPHHVVFNTEFARLVAADTWERAAAICDEMVMVTRAHSNAAVLIAAAENIRAAAAKEAKS